MLSLSQDLEQMAREQDRETDRLAIQAEAESQRRQMLRCANRNTADIFMCPVNH